MGRKFRSEIFRGPQLSCGFFLREIFGLGIFWLKTLGIKNFRGIILRYK
ncbi:MAG: hypothetical protein ACRCSK_07800 [Fusobacteriaceae bacterium]